MQSAEVVNTPVHAARRLGLNVHETLDLFLELGVRGNLTAGDVLASLKSVSSR